MTQLRYCYPLFKEEGEGHIYRSWLPHRALCGQELGEFEKGRIRLKAFTGWKLCVKCKTKRRQIKSGVSLDWSKISPQSEDFMSLSPEDKMIVLAARQAAKEQGR